MTNHRKTLNLVKSKIDFLCFDDGSFALNDAVQPDPDQAVELGDQRAGKFAKCWADD